MGGLCAHPLNVRGRVTHLTRRRCGEGVSSLRSVVVVVGGGGARSPWPCWGAGVVAFRFKSGDMYWTTRDFVGVVQ